MMARRRNRPLKVWDDPAWRRRLGKTLTVARVDEEIPTERQGQRRKPWYIALTRTPGALLARRSVFGLPDGQTLLLSEAEVIALVRYLFEPQTAIWAHQPEAPEPGEYTAVAFLQPGMLAVTHAGEIVNGEAEWSPAYFKKQPPLRPSHGLPTRKLHGLPWDMPQD